ncbi:hypothetical protein BsWGS_13827 [Bradybaena similaris]
MNRATHHIEQQLSAEQMGFRRHRGCPDAIFTLRQLAEHNIEYKNLHLAFVNLEKAFDRVDKDTLWQTLHQYGVSEHLIQLCKSPNRDCTSVIRTKQGTSMPINIFSGVRQGCVLSPLLFITYRDSICRAANYLEENTNKINELMFVDDQVLVAENEAELQHHLHSMNQESLTKNMKMYPDKTEVMTVGRSETANNLTVNNKEIKQVSEFKYLGTTFTSDGRIDKEIDIRCNKANQVLGQISPILQHAAVPLSTKKLIIQSIFIPTFSYQCQTWMFTSIHKRKITTAEMRCLRRAAGATLRDRQRNENIRKRLGIEPVLQYIERQQLKWFGHLQRMPENAPPLKAYNTPANVYKARGRP